MEMDFKKILDDLKKEEEQEKYNEVSKIYKKEYYKEWYDCTPIEIAQIKDDNVRERYRYLYNDFFTNVIHPLYNDVIIRYPEFVIDNDPKKQTIRAILYQITRYCDKEQVRDVITKK